MQKISALIFSNDKMEKTLSLIENVKDVCDEVVVMDSSDKRNSSKLTKAIKQYKGRVRLFRTLALGYADPLRQYGLNKCRHDWILYIDTDERINDELKNDLKKIVSGKKCAFAIKRYEHAHLDGSNDGFFTWQVRLYSKRMIKYRGLLHEQPLVRGKLKKLDDKYSLLHIDELKTAGAKRRDIEYSKIKTYYDRLSYELLHERMKEYLEKLFVPEVDIEDTLMGRIVLGWMRFYRNVTFRKPESEISDLDYFVFFSMIEGAYVLKRKDIKYLVDEAIPTVVHDTKNISQSRRSSMGNRIFEISRVVNREGIIRYLMLDDDRIVEKLYRKYANKKQGISLLIRLLEDRQYGNYP